MYFQWVEVYDSDRTRQIARLFRAYQEGLGFDLDFQDFDRELETLPGRYAPPTGRLVMAYGKDQPAGCVALRLLEPQVCEMKRLYVSPQFRGHGLGRLLAMHIIDLAREMGYQRMRLDTVESMTEAIGLYRSLGFHEIAPYCHNPIPGSVFMELEL